MTEPRRCSQCNQVIPADGPEGICPNCMIGFGFQTPYHEQPYAASSRTAPLRGKFTPPKPHELERDFPQLEILDLIGQGGMGAVYLARQRELDRPVALKILTTDAEHDPAFAERFSREARALARLSHPNIVTVFDSGRSGRYYYLLMEYIDGVTLRRAIDTGSLSAQEALGIVPQICEALQFAHDNGVVHRDVKPENVLLDKQGNVKVADFGLAKMLDQSPDEYALTGTHQVMGTPRYMAPEQMEGAHTVDHRADIYSLGVVFYELLTGELPLGRFAPPSKKVQVDVRLDEVVLRTLEKEPEQRYQQASQLKLDLQSLDRPRPQHRHGYDYEYRSKTTVLGIPLVHVAYGVDAETGRRRVARGIVAVGDLAIGGLAIGGVSMGAFSIGGFSVGLASIGGCSLGLLLALGGAAIGLGGSLGGLAIGGFALGGCAIGYYAMGGGTFGRYAYGDNNQDPVAREAIESFSLIHPDTLGYLSQLSLPVCLYLVVLSLLLFRRRASAAHAVPPVHVTHLPPQQSSNHGNWGFLVFAVLFACCMMGTITAAVGFLYLGMSRAPSQQPIELEGIPVSDIDLRSQLTYRLSGGQVVLNRKFVREELHLEGDRLQQVQKQLQEVYQQYLELEKQHVEKVIEASGRIVIQLSIPDQEIKHLEKQLWQRIDPLLDSQQQQVARQQLRVTPPEDERPTTVGPWAVPGILGWGSERVRIEIRQHDAMIGWRIEYRDRDQARSYYGTQLPAELLRFVVGDIPSNNNSRG